MEFRAYDGSSSGTPGAPVRITVRSPVAVAYLAQTKGQTALDGYLTETRDALSPSPVFWSARETRPAGGPPDGRRNP